MTTIRIYEVTCTRGYMMSEQGTCPGLAPWGRNTPYYEGYDDGGRLYTLPEGYELVSPEDDAPYIVDAAGHHAELRYADDGRVELVCLEAVTLQEVA